MKIISNPRALRRVRCAAVLAAASACLLLSQVHAGLKASSSIEVTEAWARATPPGAKVAAAYATLRNTSDAALTVSEVSSDSAESAELHEMDMRGGVMRMRHLKDGLRLEPGATASLEPGGMHLMLFGLREPLKAGERVLLHFKVSGGREISVYAQVREADS